MGKSIVGAMLLLLAFAGVGPAQTPKPAVDRYGDALPDGAIARLGTVRFRQGFPSYALAFAPDGKVLASVHQRRGLCLWDTESGRLLHRVPTELFANALAFSDDGKKLVAGLRLVDVATGKEVLKFEAQNENDRGISAAFSPDGKTVAATHNAGMGEIIFRDAETGKEIRSTDKENAGSFVVSVAFAPKDGKILASANFDKTVSIWNVATAKRIFRLKGHKMPVYRVAFTRDGKMLLSVSEDGQVLFWDAETGKRLREVTTKKTDGSLEAIALSSDRKSLASAGTDGAVRLWNLESGKEIHVWKLRYPAGYTLAFSPDGKKLAATANGTIRFWDTATGDEIRPFSCHLGTVISLRFTPDAKTLISFSHESQFLQWDLAARPQTSQRLNVLAARTSDGYWNAFDLSPDRKIIAQTSYIYSKDKYDSIIRLWDASTGKERGTLKGHNDGVFRVMFSPNGKLLASSGDDGVRLWNLETGKELHHWLGMAPTLTLAFAPDGDSLAIAARDGMVQQRNVATGKEIRRWETGQVAISVITYSPDGRMIATNNDGVINMINIWDAQTGKQITRIVGQAVASLAFSPTGRVLASSWVADKTEQDYESEGAIKLWEVHSGQEIRHIDTPQLLVRALAFTPDGKTLASGGLDSTILLWNVHGNPAAKLPVMARDFDALWTDLGADAGKADRALWSFALAPEKSVAFLKERLKPMPAVDAKRFAKLLGDLNSKNFADRQKAERDLVELGESVETALRKCLTDGPTLELHRRVEQILQKREPDVLRQLRAIDTLEQIGTPAAREVMESLAKSTPTPRVAQAVQRAMGRLTP